MTPDLFWLVLTALFTALIWVPYVLERMARIGLMGTLGYGEFVAVGAGGAPRRPPAAWAQRAMGAHRNAVENLPAFAVLVVAAHLAEVPTETVAPWAMVYCLVRVAHWLVYVLGVPVVRTLTFTAGWVAQIAIAVLVLTAAA